jgi:hypothetical protein
MECLLEEWLRRIIPQLVARRTDQLKEVGGPCEAWHLAEVWQLEYNHERLHWFLGGRTPHEFAVLQGWAARPSRALYAGLSLGSTLGSTKVLEKGEPELAWAVEQGRTSVTTALQWTAEPATGYRSLNLPK